MTKPMPGPYPWSRPHFRIGPATMTIDAHRWHESWIPRVSYRAVVVWPNPAGGLGASMGEARRNAEADLRRLLTAMLDALDHPARHGRGCRCAACAVRRRPDPSRFRDHGLAPGFRLSAAKRRAIRVARHRLAQRTGGGPWAHPVVEAGWRML